MWCERRRSGSLLCHQRDAHLQPTTLIARLFLLSCSISLSVSLTELRGRLTNHASIHSELPIRIWRLSAWLTRLLAGRLLARRHLPSLHLLWLLWWLLHRLSVAVAIALSWWLLTIGLRRRLLSGTTWSHRRRHLSHLHGLTVSTHGLLHARRRPACCSLWLLSRCTARHDLTHQLILLHITAKLEVVDALLNIITT